MSHSGMAVISLDFSATACCAKIQRARPAKALTRCTAGFAPSRLLLDGNLSPRKENLSKVRF